MSPAPENARLDAIDASLEHWRQGDVALGPVELVFVADASCALTPPSQALAGNEGLCSVTVEVGGVAVVTQTCDIVRSCTDRPLVHVAPLVEVTEEEADRVTKGYHPQYARIPALARTVADLDMITTVEKAVLASWQRTAGCATGEERRAFTRAVARKHSRFAFPNAFNATVKGLHNRVRKKHERTSAEGVALREHLREIRVTAEPSWDAPRIRAFLTFIRNDTELAAQADWPTLLQEWLGLCQAVAPIEAIDGTVMTLEKMTAKEYVESDPLDLDYLSRAASDPE